MITETDHLAVSLSALPAAVPPPDAAPEWFVALRDAAARRFAETGLPGPRDEDWRATRLRRLEKTKFHPAAATHDLTGADPLAPFAYDGLEGPRLVFVNGRYSAGLSHIEDLPAGVTVETFSRAFATHEALLRSHLARHAPSAAPFTALNTALLQDGVFVHVAAGVSCDAPIRVLSVTVTDEPIVTCPRNLIVVEAGASVTVIEDYEAVGDPVYLTNAVTEIVVGEKADVHHYMIELESREAFNVSTLVVRQETGSRFSSHSALFGGGLVRNNVNPVLAGEHCHSLLNGLYVAAGSQHHDNHMRVEHNVPNCDSRQYYKGVLLDESRGVFSGRIIVAKDAQKTDAIQSNENLLLSTSAQASTQPQLEIYADDVRCTHGATIGEIDEEAVFYLKSRGISADQAKNLMVHAFAGESLERMELAPVRDRLERLLSARIDRPS